MLHLEVVARAAGRHADALPEEVPWLAFDAYLGEVHGAIFARGGRAVLARTLVHFA